MKANHFQSLIKGEHAMGHKSDKKNKTEIFNERMKQRKEKAQEKARLFEEAGKPNPSVKTNDNAQQPPAPSTPATPAKPNPPAPAVEKEKANRPGKAERERRGPTRHDGRKF